MKTINEVKFGNKKVNVFAVSEAIEWKTEKASGVYYEVMLSIDGMEMLGTSATANYKPKIGEQMAEVVIKAGKFELKFKLKEPQKANNLQSEAKK